MIAVNSKQARLYLLQALLGVVALYVALWFGTGDDDLSKTGTLVIFILIVLVCWAYTIRDKNRANAKH